MPSMMGAQLSHVETLLSIETVAACRFGSVMPRTACELISSRKVGVLYLPSYTAAATLLPHRTIDITQPPYHTICHHHQAQIRKPGSIQCSMPAAPAPMG